MFKMSRPARFSSKIYRSLGFDPGFAITGYGVVDRRAGEMSCVAYGVIRTPRSMGLPDRLRFIYHEAKFIIERYHPSVIGVEKIFFAKNKKTGLTVSEARGVILLASAEARIDLIEVTPLQVKQAMTSYGRAEKAQIQAMVKRILNLKITPRPDDAADALAVALTVERCGMVERRL